VLYIIDDILEEMAVENKKHFSPHYVCSRAGTSDLKSVTKYLLDLVGKKLNVYFEVECPEGDSDYAVNSPEEIENDFRFCSICQTEYIPSPDKIWIGFDFIPEYIDYVKKKVQKPELVLV